MAGYGYGYFQGGVPIGSNVNLSSQYKTILAAMSTEPSLSDKIIQNDLVKGLVDAGVYDKAVFLDLFSVHAADAANLNWANPGTFDPTPVNSPEFEAYGGYTGAVTGSKYVRSNFIPSEHSDLIQLDNMCFIVGVGNNLLESTWDFGAMGATTTQISFHSWRGGSPANSMYLNGNTALNVATATSIGHFSATRNSTANHRRNKNTGLQQTYVIDNNSALSLVDKELYICARNTNGTAECSNHQIRYAFLFSYLTDYEVNSVIDLMETYLRKYGKGIITTPVAYHIEPTKIQFILPTIEDAIDGRAIHPSVIDLGIWLNGYRYWMSNTPYTQAFEYPHIYASNDGVNWVVPSGYSNPAYPLQGGTNFAPDPNLYFENDTLYCFFMYQQDATHRISYIKTTDGITWSDRIDTNLITDTFSTIKAPSIIKLGDNYYMYLQNDPANTIQRYKSATLEGEWVDLESLVVTDMIGDSHVDIFERHGYIWMMMSENGQIFSLFYSADGLNFTKGDNRVVINRTATEFDKDGVYKASNIIIDGKELCYYSGFNEINGVGLNSARTGSVELKFIIPV